MVPADVLPSPQAMVAVKSAGVESGFPSVKVATMPLKG